MFNAPQKKTPRHVAAVVLSLIAAVATLVACGGSSSKSSTASSSGSSSSAAPHGGTLTLAVNAPPPSLDNLKAQPNSLLPFYQPVYDSLMREQPDGSLAPMLATKWTYSSDRMTLTLNLRTDVQFTDGTKFDATAAKTNLMRLKTANAAESADLASVNNIDTPDATTVVLHLSAPDPGLLNDLANVAGYMASPTAITGGQLATHPVGSGPYVYDTANSVAGSKLVFTANPTYWDKSLQHYDRIVFSVLVDPTASLNAMISGQVNAGLLTPKNRQAASGAGLVEASYDADVSLIYLFDRAGVLTPALKDVRVRQAVNYAIDKDALLKQVYLGTGTVTSQVFSKTSDAYVASLDSTYNYDPAKAKSLLAQAGYPSGFSMAMPQIASIDPAIYAAITQNLKDVGISVKPISTPPTDLLANMAKQQFSAMYSFVAQRDAWNDYVRLISPNGSYNPFHTTDPKVTDFGNTMQTDPSKAKQAAQDLNKYIVDQAWFVPLLRYQQIYFTDKHTTVKPTVNQPLPSIWYYSPK